MRLHQSENCTPCLYFLPQILVTSCQILTAFPALRIPHSWNQARHPCWLCPFLSPGRSGPASCPWDCTLGRPLSQGSVDMAPRPPPSGCSPTAGCPQQGALHLGLSAPSLAPALGPHGSLGNLRHPQLPPSNMCFIGLRHIGCGVPLAYVPLKGKEVNRDPPVTGF